MEVADTRQSEPREPLEEVPHAIATKGYTGTDGVAGAQSELRDRTLGLCGHRVLAGDRGEVADGRVDGLRVRKRLSEADIDDDLGNLRHIHRIGVAELLHQGRDGLFLVTLMEAAAHSPGSSCSRQWPHTRTLWPLPRRSCLTLVTRSQRGQTSITLLASIGIGLSTMPPCCISGARSFCIFWRGLVWRLAIFTPAITTEIGRLDARRQYPPTLSADARLRRTRSTLPRLPASLPCSTTTVSPVLISGTRLDGVPLICAIRAPPARGRRSSCSCGLAVHGQRGQRCGCPAGSPGY